MRLAVFAQRSLRSRVWLQPLPNLKFVHLHYHLAGPPGLSNSTHFSQMASGSSESQSTLHTLNFVNSALKALPLDSTKENYVRSVQGACFSRVIPTPLKNPQLVGSSLSALSLLGLSPSEIGTPEFVEYFSGNLILPGSEPAAHCYCGHQFGSFAGQLGDGCAILLGEVETKSGKRWELQLKGSGKTPYSRSADGRKVLRSSIREFLCSEAMHHLGIPTTRAGTCITSDDYVERDIFYNGDVIMERATVISRIAPSFIRFGSFEIFKPRDMMTGRVGPSVGLTDILNQLVDYVIENFYPEIYQAHKDSRESRTAAFYQEVCVRTARLVAQWQCVGFCHGVLNTDNMSILGLTIDYGPFGFLDRFDPHHICNGSDHQGRYAYDQQPQICRWNLKKLAEALAPNGLSEDKVKEGLRMYDEEFSSSYLSKMRLKLGLIHRQLPDDTELIEALFETMHKTGCDFTNCFQCLSLLRLPSPHEQSNRDEVVKKLLKECATPPELMKGYKPMMRMDQLEMLSSQPPALLAALGMPIELIQSEMLKHKEMEKLKSMSSAKKKEEDREAWTLWLTTYQDRLRLDAEAATDRGKSYKEILDERQTVMKKNNPRIILRNHIAQKAVEMAEQGDFSEVHSVLRMLETPYSSDGLLESFTKTAADNTADQAQSSQRADREEEKSSKGNIPLEAYFSKPPIEALGLCVT